MAKIHFPEVSDKRNKPEDDAKDSYKLQLRPRRLVRYQRERTFETISACSFSICGELIYPKHLLDYRHLKFPLKYTPEIVAFC